MKHDKTILVIMTSIFSALIISSISGDNASDTAKNIAISVVVSPTPLPAATALSGYTYGFTCHAESIRAASIAVRKNDQQALHKAVRSNEKCFQIAKKIAGI